MMAVAGHSVSDQPPQLKEVALPATLIARTGNAFTVQVEIPYGPSMLDAAATLQRRLNEAGTRATAESLQRFEEQVRAVELARVGAYEISRLKYKR